MSTRLRGPHDHHPRPPHHDPLHAHPPGVRGMLIRLTPNAHVVSMGDMMQNTPDVSNEVSLRYGVNGRTVHLSRNVVIGGVPVSFCNTEVRHYFGGGTYTVNGQRSYGSHTVKLCKRCIHPNCAAIVDGIIAFVLWASWGCVIPPSPYMNARSRVATRAARGR